MADLLRLIFMALVWALLSSSAHASFTAPYTWKTDYNGVGGNTTWQIDAVEACKQDAAARQAANAGKTWVFQSVDPESAYPTRYCYDLYNGASTVAYLLQRGVVACPANATLSGGSCTCNSGYQETSAHNACEPIPAVNLCTDLAGMSAGTYNGPAGSGPVLGLKQLCVTEVSSGDSAQPGCRATGQATFGYQSTAVGSIGDMYWQAQFAFTGEKCNPNASGSTDASGSTPSVPPAPGSSTGQTTQCPIGKVPGEVNGVTICVTPGTDTPQQRKNDTGSTEQKADGTTVEKSTSKQTVCDATKCTTTTTTTTKTTPPGGTASTTTETSTSTCVVGSPDCTAKAGVGGGGGAGGGAGGEDAGFGGSCTAAFNCKGDAVMCAVALEQHKRNCALFVDSSPESNLYGSEKTKTGTQYTSENVTISSGSFNGSNAFGGSAQCIQDKTIVVAGHSVTLPFSQVCATLAHLGTLLMTVSMLLAYRIVARG